jgi:uncharacterized protein
MTRVRVISRKYDGSLRDEYEAYLYAETEQAIMLFSPAGMKYWDHRKYAWFEAPDGLIEIYFKYRWYNVWHICEQVSHTNLIYTNIAMPATFQKMRLEWTDLDLDYRVHLNHAVELLDQSEFEENARRWGYPQHLIEQAQAACREVEAGLASRTFPFDHEGQVEHYRRLKHELYPAEEY